MASEQELMRLLERRGAIVATEANLMRLFKLGISESLASGEIAPSDPEFKALAARGVTLGLELLEMAAETAAEHQALHGGEKVAAEVSRQAASAVELRAEAEDFIGFMLAMNVVAASHSQQPQPLQDEEDAGQRRRTRKPNPKYYGPQWSNK